MFSEFCYFSVSNFASYSVFLGSFRAEMDSSHFSIILRIRRFNRRVSLSVSCLTSALFNCCDSHFLLWMRFIWAAAGCFNCVRVCAQSALDDTFVSGSVSGRWPLFRNTKAAQKAVFTSTATLKGCNNVARRCGVSQQCHGTTSLNPKLICPHRL